MIVSVGVGVDENVAAGPSVAGDVGVTVSGRAEWLLATDRGEL